jgi:hypothetical protein
VPVVLPVSIVVPQCAFFHLAGDLAVDADEQSLSQPPVPHLMTHTHVVLVGTAVHCHSWCDVVQKLGARPGSYITGECHAAACVLCCAALSRIHPADASHVPATLAPSELRRNSQAMCLVYLHAAACCVKQ